MIVATVSNVSLSGDQDDGKHSSSSSEPEIKQIMDPKEIIGGQ